MQKKGCTAAPEGYPQLTVRQEGNQSEPLILTKKGYRNCFDEL